MADIIGIGSTCYDVLMKIDRFPLEDTKQAVQEMMTQGGGLCATALVAASKLGVSTSFIGSIGDDVYGRLILDEFAQYGVATDYTFVRKNRASIYSLVLINTTNALRTCIYHGGDAESVSPDELPVEAIKQAKLLLIDARHPEATLRAVKIAKENGVTVAIDMETGLDTRPFLPYVDLMIPSEPAALEVTGCDNAEDAAKKLYEQYHPRVVVITQGVKGGILFEGKLIEHYPAFPVEAIDTNGAGDIFHGAFVAAYLKGRSFLDCAIIASAVSAIKCMHFGARACLPTFEETERFIERQLNA